MPRAEVEAARAATEVMIDNFIMCRIICLGGCDGGGDVQRGRGMAGD